MIVFAMSCSSTEPPVEKPVDPDFLPGEIRPDASKPCFQGAYYRKVVSSVDKWRGIYVKVVLPHITCDPDRYRPDYPLRCMDNPSIYIGGRSDNRETDVGVLWEIIRDANGNVTPDRRNFRPFWRTPASDNSPGGWFNADAQNTDYHYDSGDTISMSVLVVRDGIILFKVEGHGRIAHKKFSVEIPCSWYAPRTPAEYKRVNAIDQYNNEGKPASPTKAKVEGLEWLETSLYRLQGTEIITVPMHSRRYTDMRCPDVKHFTITASEEDLKIGAEKVDIYGTPE
jgi:hypothetical protein